MMQYGEHHFNTPPYFHEKLSERCPLFLRYHWNTHVTVELLVRSCLHSRLITLIFLLCGGPCFLPCGRKDSTLETLFLMMDEKFMPFQREPQRRSMVHHAVIFKGMGPTQGYAKRNMLINRHAVASTNQNSLNYKVSDYMCEAYDAGRVRIKASAKEYANVYDML